MAKIRVKRAGRVQLLLAGKQNLNIEDVAAFFGVSVGSARRYQELGIVDVSARDGARLQFDPDDVRWARDQFRRLRAAGYTVPLVAREIQKLRLDRPHVQG